MMDLLIYTQVINFFLSSGHIFETLCATKTRSNLIDRKQSQMV